MSDARTFSVVPCSNAADRPDRRPRGADNLEGRRKAAPGDVHSADITWNLGGERSQIGVQAGVVGGLQNGRSHPPVPFDGDECDEAAPTRTRMSSRKATPSHRGGRGGAKGCVGEVGRGPIGFVGDGLRLVRSPVVHGLRNSDAQRASHVRDFAHGDRLWGLNIRAPAGQWPSPG